MHRSGKKAQLQRALFWTLLIRSLAYVRKFGWKALRAHVEQIAFLFRKLDHYQALSLRDDLDFPYFFVRRSKVMMPETAMMPYEDRRLGCSYMTRQATGKLKETELEEVSEMKQISQLVMAETRLYLLADEIAREIGYVHSLNPISSTRNP